MMMEATKKTNEITETTDTYVSSPIFILGVMPRSGTHFLSHLICLHPSCRRSAFDEDYLLSYSDYLTKFANGLQNQWELLEDVKDLGAKEMLIESLGEGLLLFLRRSRKKALETRANKFNFDLPQESFNKRIVTKTPYIDNLHKFFSFFPDVHLLILVRDGRAVVESGVRSFQSDSELITREWSMSVDRILSFDRDPEISKYKYMIVRYEDLFTNTESNIEKILDFLKLDKSSYDFGAAKNAPVLGSSTFKRGNTPHLNWKSEKKTEEFNPLARAATWTRAQHERFNWLAAEQLKAFGYEPKTYSDNRLFWTIRNKALDLKWSCKVWLRRFKKGFIFVARRIRAYSSNNPV